MTYQVSQQTANEILYEAFINYHLYGFMGREELSGWREYREKASAFYQAWSMITNIEFENGIHDLRKFTEDDFADVIAKQEAEMFADWMEEYDDLGISDLL